MSYFQETVRSSLDGAKYVLTVFLMGSRICLRCDGAHFLYLWIGSYPTAEPSSPLLSLTDLKLTLYRQASVWNASIMSKLLQPGLQQVGARLLFKYCKTLGIGMMAVRAITFLSWKSWFWHEIEVCTFFYALWNARIGVERKVLLVYKVSAPC